MRITLYLARTPRFSCHAEGGAVLYTMGAIFGAPRLLWVSLQTLKTYASRAQLSLDALGINSEPLGSYIESHQNKSRINHVACLSGVCRDPLPSCYLSLNNQDTSKQCVQSTLLVQPCLLYARLDLLEYRIWSRAFGAAESNNSWCNLESSSSAWACSSHAHPPVQG